MGDVPQERIPIEGGWGSALLGILITSLSLVMMCLVAFFPQADVESFLLSLITVSCLLATGAAILTLVSDYPLILSSVSIFLLLLYWRLRYAGATWLLALSILTFLLALALHKKSSRSHRWARRRKHGK